MNLFGLLERPQECEVVLLSKIPTSSNPASFDQVKWPNYRPIMTTLFLEMVNGQGGLIYSNVPFEVSEGSYQIVAYALVKDGICLFVGQLDPSSQNEITAGTNVLQARTILFISRFPS